MSDQGIAREAGERMERFIEGLIHGALEALRASAALVDDQGKIVAVNRAWRAFADANGPLRANVCEGADYLAVCENAMAPPSEEARTFAAGLRAVLAGEQEDFTLTYACHSPTVERWFICRVTPFEAGGKRYAFIAHEDITERTLFERQLRASETRYRRMIETANEGVWALDREFRAAFVNEKMAQMLGYTPAEMLGQPVHTFMFPEDLSDHALRMEARQAGQHEIYKRRFRRKDGSECWCQVSATALRDEHDEFAGSFAMLTDITERVRAEETLRQSEERLRLVLEAASDGFWDWDVRTNQLYFSERYYTLLGYAPGEFEATYENWQRLVHPDDLPAAEEAVHAPIRTGQPGYSAEWRLRAKSGVWIWVNSRGKVVEWDAAGEPTRLVGALVDITERKLAEETLRVSEARLRQAQRLAQLGYWDWDAVTGELQWSEEIYHIFGQDARTFHPTVEAFQATLHPADRERSIAKSKQLLDDPNCHSMCMEHRIIRPDGLTRHVRELAKIHRDERGQVVHVSGVVQDITELRQLEETARILAELLDASPAAVTVHDYAGNFLYANEKALTLHGYSREEFLSLNLHQLDVPESERVIASRMQELLERGEAHFEVQHFRRDGLRIPLWVDAKVTRWADQPVIMSVTYDLTERQRAEAERLELERRLLHAQRLESLGVLAGGIAHDFNNLLMTILGNLDLALLDVSSLSPAREGIQQAMKAARRAADLTRQMLAYAGKGRLILKGVNLSELAREDAHLFRAAISKTVSLNLQLEPNLPTIQADPGQIQQVVMNLITNASEAIGEGIGVVTITTGVQDCDEAELSASRIEEKPPAGRFVFVEVTDTGCGMSDEVQQHLFEPFFSTKFAGRGLGMPVVLGIVRGHKGAIFVKSAVGQGTTVRVLFPVSAQQEAPAESAPAGAKPTAARRFRGLALVVDDEEEVRLVCATMLRRAGMQVLDAPDGEAALEIFRERAGEIVCVILDLMMPRKDGLDTFREMKRLRPNVPVILCSGYDEVEATRRFAGEGLAGFLQKPFSVQDLRARLEAIIPK